MSDQALGVLVSAASKHGSTTEIATRIGEVIAQRDMNVTVAEPQNSPDPSGFRAVILGSAVYAGHWLSEAKELADRIASSEAKPDVWLFSSGPIGEPPKPEEDPVDVETVSKTTDAIEHRLFAGKIDKGRLGFGERAIVSALRAPEGDFRDWTAIDAWANEIVDSLKSSQLSS